MADSTWDDILRYGTEGVASIFGTPAAGAAVDQLFFDGKTMDEIGGAVGGVAEDFANAGQTRWRAQPIQVSQYDPGQLDYDYALALSKPLSDAGKGANQRSSAAFDAMMRGPQAASATYGSASTAEAAHGQAFQGEASLGDAYFGDLNQAYEDQMLSDREYGARMGDQSGALQLLREGAMGLAPSEAQYMMQRGLDQGLAAQQAQMGSARGQAALALAGGNAMANSAAMQNQAYLQAAQLRAKEMQDYTNAYSNAANQMRAQDQQRLGLGNQMSIQNAQFANDMSLANARQAQDASFQNAGMLTNTSNANAGLATNASLQNANMTTNANVANAQMATQASLANAAQANQMAAANAAQANQYQLGVGQVGAQYGQLGLSYNNAAQNAYSNQLKTDMDYKALMSDNYNKAATATANSWDTTNNVNAGLIKTDAEAKANARNAGLGFAGTIVQTAGGILGGKKG